MFGFETLLCHIELHSNFILVYSTFAATAIVIERKLLLFRCYNELQNDRNV